MKTAKFFFLALLILSGGATTATKLRPQLVEACHVIRRDLDQTAWNKLDKKMYGNGKLLTANAQSAFHLDHIGNLYDQLKIEASKASVSRFSTVKDKVSHSTELATLLNETIQPLRNGKKSLIEEYVLYHNQAPEGLNLDEAFLAVDNATNAAVYNYHLDPKITAVEVWNAAGTRVHPQATSLPSKTDIGSLVEGGTIMVFGPDLWHYGVSTPKQVTTLDRYSHPSFSSRSQYSNK